MTRRITLAIATVLAALFLSVGLAAAQDPPETATATRLEPGLNLVGWVGEPAPVSQLFQQIPKLEAIWAWDAELRDWIVAAPGAPEWLGGLGRVTAGMGLRMQLSGDEPFFWQRSTEPTRGLVKLRTGWNLVAWSGADGAAIGDVVKGIGWSLRTVRRWNAVKQQWDIWTSPERSAQVIANTGADQDADSEAETPGIRRGEALWIEVARAVNWLQPTEILPRLFFPGGASQELQTRVHEDLQATLSFFRDQYGIQAAPDFTVYVAKDVDALIQAYKDDGQDVDEAYEASERALWNRADGWGGSKVVVKQSHWPDDLSTNEIVWARYLVTHEYFHVLQWQLLRRSNVQWLVEGTANWAEAEHEVLDGGGTWANLRESHLSAIADAPTLRSTEIDNAEWEYDLGWLATEQLVADAGADSWIEFWRQFAPTEIGPHRRWISRPDWQTVFQGVFGRPVSEFYADFDAWQREQAVANPTATSSYNGRWIRGRVTRDSGTAVAGVFVNAIRVEGETSVGWNQRAETGVDGIFAIRAPEDGDYRLSIDITDDCRRYYSDGQLINDREQWDDWQEARPVKVGQSDVSDINIRLPPNVCGWQIRGRIVGPNTEPFAGVSISACNSKTLDCVWVQDYTAHDGLFAVRVPTRGDYRLMLNLGNGCAVHYSSKGLTFERDRVSLIAVSEGDVGDVSIEVPPGMCPHSISGALISSDGQPLDDTLVSACLEEDGNCVAPYAHNTDSDGAFEIAVPTEGSYRLSFSLEGCTVYFAGDGLTTDWQTSYTVRVEGRSLRMNPRQISEGMCAHRISGRFVDSSGDPLSEQWFNMHGPGPDGRTYGFWTNADGHFEIRALSDGAYSFSIQLRSQPYCWHKLAEQTLGSPNNPVQVSGADVTGIVLRLPGTIEDLCE